MIMILLSINILFLFLTALNNLYHSYNSIPIVKCILPVMAPPTKEIANVITIASSWNNAWCSAERSDPASIVLL